MKLLLTGASGFLGQSIKPLLEKRYEVKTLGLTNNNDLTVNLSTTTPEILHSFDLVFHAAGKAHMKPKTELERKAFFDVNYQGTINLCKSLEKTLLLKTFIFISTVAVYGLESGIDITESHPLNGDNPYAKSKILTEQFLINWSKENNINLVIFRLPLIAGNNPPGNLGAMIDGIKTGKYLSIGKADAKKSMVWAEDIANIIPQAIKVGGIYNLTDRYHPSFGELENKIASTLNKRQPLKVSMGIANILGKIGDIIGNKSPINSDKLEKITSTLTFSDEKAVKLLNWNPSKVLDKIPEMLKIDL